MKCSVCGAESGIYPLCRECYRKKEESKLIRTGQAVSSTASVKAGAEEPFLYQLKPSLVTHSEMGYLKCIRDSLPEGYLVQPQANLASFIARTDGARYQNELYRNVDFIITDLGYRPICIVEVNDQSHLLPERRERDKKVAAICEEAGIPIIRLWTSYGVNTDYIKKRVTGALSSPPPARVHHFAPVPAAAQEESKPPAPAPKEQQEAVPLQTQAPAKKGCYIATCVYGSYDCPEVWRLRRFRDQCLEERWYGPALIRLYYAVSPWLVRRFGGGRLFRGFWKWYLGRLDMRLKIRGISGESYEDRK